MSDVLISHSLRSCTAFSVTTHITTTQGYFVPCAFGDIAGPLATALFVRIYIDKNVVIRKQNYRNAWHVYIVTMRLFSRANTVRLRGPFHYTEPV